MTSKYLARATPRAYESARELVGMWMIKARKAGGRAWAVEQDMIGATMVSSLTSCWVMSDYIGCDMCVIRTDWVGCD